MDATPDVTITQRGAYRIITSNAIPEHPTGQFPNRGNPNTMRPQALSLQVPVQPVESSTTIPNPRGFFGIGLNGVPFEPQTAEWWKNDPATGWHLEVKSPNHSLGLDQNNAHVQPSGLYHYHGPPTGLIRDLSDRTKDGASMIQLGWAADGYPIYSSLGHADAADSASPLKRLRSSWQLKPGARPGEPAGPGGSHDGTYEQDFVFVEGSGELDELNGRTGVTPEFPRGTYYYVVTEEFPFISRGFHGAPNSSFAQKGGASRGGGRPPRGPQGRDDRRGRRPPPPQRPPGRRGHRPPPPPPDR